MQQDTTDAKSKDQTKSQSKRRTLAATVTGKAVISPNMLRLTAVAPGLIGSVLDKTDHYIKILFVPEGAGYSWPFDLGEVKDTFPRHLHPVTRTYTLRSVDVTTGEFTVDFVIHGDAGLAAPWARDVNVGETFAFIGPGGGWAPAADYDTIVLAGDESAAPAIAAALEHLPAATSAIACIEVEQPGEEIPLPSAHNIDVRFVYRHGAVPGMMLSQAVRDLPVPAGRTGWFVHGVAEMIKELRRHLFVTLGVAKQDASISGYWRLHMTEDEWQASKRDFVTELEAQEAAATSANSTSANSTNANSAE